MKRTALALILITILLLLAIAGTMRVNLTTANPAPLFPFPWGEPVSTPPTIVVYSPIQNQTFDSTSVLLYFSIVKPETWFPNEYWREFGYNNAVFGNVTSVYYMVDGGERQNITVHDTDTLFTASAARTLNFSVNLVLGEGTHDVTVSLDADSYYAVLDNEKGFILRSVVVRSDSETIVFVVQPFPTAFAFALSGVSVAFVGSVLLLVLKKRRRG